MYYGCDTNSNSFPCSGSGLFYIGRMGGGTTSGGGGWNQNAADTAGSAHTYGYWDIEGLGTSTVNATTLSDAYTWGKQQAQAAKSAWDANSSVGGSTIFGDVESGNTGIGVSSTLDQQVYLGFMDELNNLLSVSGVYSSPGEWDKIMGSSFSASPATCVYSADWTEPCGSCPTSITGAGFGGYTPTIWQYNGNTGGGSPCAADLDCAGSLPS